MRRAVRVVFTAAAAALSIGLLALILAASGLDAGDVARALGAVPPAFLVLAAALSLTELGLRILRFHLILRGFGQAPALRGTTIAQLIGIFAGNVSPLRVGEPLKAFVLKRKYGVPASIGVVATILERALDLTILALLLLAAVVSGVTLPLGPWVAGLFAIAFTALYFMIVASLMRAWPTRLLLWFEGRWPRFRRIRLALEQVAAGGHSLATASLGWAALSFVILVVDVAMLYVLLLGYGAAPPYLGVLAAVVLATLGGLATHVPGGLGATEALLISLLVVQGVAPEVAVVTTIASRLVSFYAFTFAGWALATREGIDFREASRTTAGDSVADLSPAQSDRKTSRI